MDESPVIDDSDDFVPMPETGGDAGAEPAPAPPEADPARQRVINNPGGFVPMRPEAAKVRRMPTPDQVLHQEDSRLDAVPFEFADIRALAQRILKRAQEQGQQKIEAARSQVAAMEKQAYDKAYKEAFPKGKEEGFAKGEQEGRAQADAKIAAAVKAEKESIRGNAAPVTGVLQQLTNAINESKAQLMAQAEGDLLLLAIDLAKRLVGHELSVDPEAIKPLAIECIGLVTDRTGITARVNPEDYRVLEEFYPQLKQIFPDLGPVKVVPDPDIERGGIYAATREAEVDMRLATRLAAFEEVILGFSGEDAVAPWSRIPADAIEEAKRAQAESAYTLPPAGSEQDEAEESGAPAPEPEEDAAAGQGGQSVDPAGLDDLADLADLADGQGETP